MPGQARNDDSWPFEPDFESPGEKRATSSVHRPPDQAASKTARCCTGAGRFVDDLRFAGHAGGGVRAQPARPCRRSARIDTSAARAGAPACMRCSRLRISRPLLTQERLPLQFAHRAAAARHHAVRACQGRSRLCRRGGGGGDRGRRRYIAEDAAALVAVDYEPLPAVVRLPRRRSSRARRAPIAAAPSNLLIEFRQSYGDVAGAFARAPHRASVRLKQHRGGAHSIEGARRARRSTTSTRTGSPLWSSTQLAHEVRAFLMKLLRLDENQMRVVAPDVGGGFGAKFVMYPGGSRRSPRRACMLRRPVKWIEDRREHFLAAIQERDQYLGPRGRLRRRRPAARRAWRDDPRPGRLHAAGHQPALQRLDRAARPYLLPAYELDVRVVETNKVATMPVRGAGYPEGAFAMERLLDRIARRARARPRRGAPPQPRAGGQDALRHAAQDARRLGDRARQRRLSRAASAWRSRPSTMPASPSASAVRARKVAISASASATASRAPGAARSNPASCASAAPASISVYTGAMPMGQGIKTALAQICAEQFGVAPDDITVAAGDTAAIPLGQGGFASRQTVTAGSAVHLAAVAVRDKALKVAAHLLEVERERPRTARRPHRDRRRAGQRADAARSRRSGVRRARLCHARQVRARARKHAELPAQRAHLWRGLPCRRGRGRYRDLRRAHPALCRGQRQRPRHQSDDRRGPD